MQPFAKIAGAALAVLVLAGCTSDFYDSRMRGYVPSAMPDKRYPIEVVKGNVKLRLQVVSGKLQASERQALRRLVQDAVSFDTSRIYITRPAGSARAELLAARVTRELIANGISRERIVHRTGGAPGELSISYSRKFAVTRECGDWSEPATETAHNGPVKDFGCSVQHNLAAQVDNPEDLERPRIMGNPDTESRSEMMQKYRKRQDYSSAKPRGFDDRLGN